MQIVIISIYQQPARTECEHMSGNSRGLVSVSPAGWTVSFHAPGEEQGKEWGDAVSPSSLALSSYGMANDQ